MADEAIIDRSVFWNQLLDLKAVCSGWKEIERQHALAIKNFDHSTTTMRFRLLALCLWAVLIFGLEWADGVGRLPALGWSSWNAYGCNISHTSFLRAAEAMVNLGLKVFGLALPSRSLTDTQYRMLVTNMSTLTIAGL